MSIRRMVQDLNDLKFSYSGRDLARIQSAIDSLNAIGSGEASVSRSQSVSGTDYSYDYDAHKRYGPARYGRSSYQEHGLMGPPSYNSDRTQDGCPECQPGRPCYGHGH